MNSVVAEDIRDLALDGHGRTFDDFIDAHVFVASMLPSIGRL
ncbi:hypothetical protein V1281_001548 [Nitrobacteraceae bacterium AZCC 2161]